MRVEFHVSGVSATEQDCYRLADIMDQVARGLKVSTDGIEEVIIATSDTFGDVVGRFDASKKYTNGRGLVTAGKIFPHRSPGSPVKHSILLLHDVVARVFQALDSGVDFDDWTGDEQRCLYVLFHELGHCIDDQKRSEVTDDGTYRSETGRRMLKHDLESLWAYHRSTLLSEFYACVHSGIMYTGKVRDLDVDMNNGVMAAQLEELMEKTKMPSVDLSEIRYEAAAIFWFMLTQHAKLAGSRISRGGYDDLPPSKLWRLAHASEEMEGILVEVDRHFDALWQAYPTLESTFADDMTDCFLRLAAYCGYKFSDLSGNDGIWWDSPRQLRGVIEAKVS